MLWRTLNQFHCISFCLSDFSPKSGGMKQIISQNWRNIKYLLKYFLKSGCQVHGSSLLSSEVCPHTNHSCSSAVSIWHEALKSRRKSWISSRPHTGIWASKLGSHRRFLSKLLSHCSVIPVLLAAPCPRKGSESPSSPSHSSQIWSCTELAEVE